MLDKQANLAVGHQDPAHAYAFDLALSAQLSAQQQEAVAAHHHQQAATTAVKVKQEPAEESAAAPAAACAPAAAAVGVPLPLTVEMPVANIVFSDGGDVESFPVLPAKDVRRKKPNFPRLCPTFQLLSLSSR